MSQEILESKIPDFERVDDERDTSQDKDMEHPETKESAVPSSSGDLYIGTAFVSVGLLFIARHFAKFVFQ